MTLERRIHDKLVKALTPAALEVINESHMHAVPPNSETHFKVVVVSDHFVEMGLVQRHRVVNQLLADELRDGVHALSIHAYSPEQWNARGQEARKSPPCEGGSKAEGG